MKHPRINDLLIAALIALAIALLAYACRFHSFEVSHDPEDWAKFGEYVGGTLGAAFGLLAIVGVLLTIAESREGHRNELRPWIQITSVHAAAGSLQCIDGKWRFGFTWNIKNVGKSPALRTHFAAKMVPEVFRTTESGNAMWIADVSKELRSLAESPDLVFFTRGKFGRFLFPDTTMGGGVNFADGMPNPISERMSAPDYTGRILLLVGVTYQSPLDPPGDWHETCEAYVITILDQQEKQVRIASINGQFALGNTRRVQLNPHEVADNYVT